MILFLAVITLFPLLVGVILKSKYLVALCSLVAVSLAIFIFDYLHFMRPENLCLKLGAYQTTDTTCGHGQGTAAMVPIILIIMIAPILWYLAFMQKDRVTGLAANKLTKPTLRIAGWLIIAFILLTIGGFILAFSQI